MVLYAGPFLLLASIPAFFYGFGWAGPLLTIALLLAALIGAEFVTPRGDVLKAGFGPANFRTLFYLYVPLQLASVVWATALSTRIGTAGFVCLVLSVGIATGVFGMLAAHELVHSKSKPERVLGAAMLSGMLYRHFRIAHVHVHHRFAATDRDSATARLGEGFYAFLLRTLPGQFREAWAFEKLRCGKVANSRIAVDVAVALATLVAVAGVWRWQGLLFFVAQSFVAVTVLELFNYIAHYGLTRRELAPGKFEPLADRHSWNSSNVAVNLLIFNMGRHTYHHRKPSISYEELQYVGSAPELPAGYAGSILLALVPPLWRRVMDARVADHMLPHAETRLAA
ncbi:MAG TPA: alkane 1-monooxygenase [Rhizomicrobium sp.]|nr:alkane 1-monooxygenase [Rhizomicrobium sp.]